MPYIQQLPTQVSDMIAAGEVVERPASVVKELVENAIDAGATTIVVEIQGGGMASIRVTDNGCGIAPEELPTAFLRHATSKLHVPEDLAAIGTLGFRGEALAAIAAVSQMDIFTRQKGANLGATLALDGGVPGTVESAGCPEGTTVVVRRLFYHTPARLKFMKSDAAEAAAVGTVVGQIALGRPEISLRYLRDGKEELHTPGDGKLLSAIYAVRGRDFAHSLVPVGGRGDGIEVRGYTTEPLAGRGNRGLQTFFCCGRLVKVPLLTAALEEAYANRQMKGKFPGCVLYITLPLDQMDVNVHPAKTMVKFVREHDVFSAVHHVVKDALDGVSAAPTAVSSHSQQIPVSAVPTAKNSFYRTMDAKTFRESVAKPPARSGRVTFRDSNPPPPLFQEKAPPLPLPNSANAIHTEEKPTPAVRAEEPAPPPPEPTVFSPTVPAWEYRGELWKTYILAQDGDNVWLIDKHAAHERIQFDRLKANQEPVMRQQLLSSVAVDLPPEQCRVLLEQQPLLDAFGFVVEDFGDGMLLVRAIPADLDTALVRETLEELAEKLLTCGGADPVAARDAMLHTVACKAAIRGGDTSDPAELQALIRKVQSGEVQYCPHGRPVKIKIKKYDIEKLFKRA